MKGFLFVAPWVVVLCIVVQAAALPGLGQAKIMSATGTVKSISRNSLTITAAGGKEMSFVVDSNTKFVGRGLGTKQAKQGKLIPTLSPQTTGSLLNIPTSAAPCMPRTCV